MCVYVYGCIRVCVGVCVCVHVRVCDTERETVTLLGEG